jgi:hypothetical protein
VSRRPTVPRAAVGAALLAAACGTILPRPAPVTPPAPTVWIVTRPHAVARRVAAPTAPALAIRTIEGPASVRAADATAIRATLVGPIATVVRSKRYAAAGTPIDALVTFTPPASPARQDHLVRVGGRTVSILVREPAEAQSLARSEPDAERLDVAADGSVTVPVGTLPGGQAATLEVETTGIVPFKDGAYELHVPRVPEGDVSFTSDLYGTGPIVVVSSPTHPIDARPSSDEHLRVTLREPAGLRDADFVLRYRVDPEARAGAFVVRPSAGTESIVGILVHPLERNHEPVAASDVTIDWNGSAVADVRPAALERVAPGAPIVVVGRATGPIAGPVQIRAVVGRETRTIVVDRDDTIPATSLAALPVLWARAVRVAVTGAR